MAMRVFTDNQGQTWEAATVFGSYGATRLIFSRRSGDELRVCDMQSGTLHDAEQELASCTEITLRDWLHGAAPWQ